VITDLRAAAARREHGHSLKASWSSKRGCPAAAGANQVFKQKSWRSMAAAKHNKDRSSSESDSRLARALKRDKVSLCREFPCL
jgi:hypothetical protein